MLLSGQDAARSKSGLPRLLWVALYMLLGLGQALPSQEAALLSKRQKPHRQAKFQPPAEVTTLYRGDRRPPEDVEKTGGFFTKQVLEKLTPEQEEASSSLWAHVTKKTNQYTKYISTTADPSVAYNFAAKGQQGGYIYVISPDTQMIDATGTLGDHVDLKFRNEFEYSAVGKIPFSQVRGWYPSQAIPERDIQRLRDGETLDGFVKNPSYDAKFDSTRASGVRYELAGFGPEVKDAFTDKNFKKLKGKSTSQALQRFVKEVVCGNKAACSTAFWKQSPSQSPAQPPAEEEPGKAPAQGGSPEEPQPGSSTPEEPQPGPSTPEDPEAGPSTPKDPKAGKKIPGSGTDRNEFLNKKPKGIKSPCVIAKKAKRAVDCDVTERAKYKAAGEFEVEYEKVGSKAPITFQAREMEALEAEGRLPKGSASKMQAPEILEKIVPAKAEFLTMNLINQLDKNNTPFWQELVDGLKNSEFTIADCQIGFKKALSNTLNRRYTEFENADHALGSIFNIAMDTFDLVTLRPPAGFYMDLVAEIPKECKAVAAAKTPEEKLKVASEDVDTLVQVWSDYTPVGIETQRWAERLAKNPDIKPIKAVETTIYDFWSMTPIGWLFNKAFPSVRQQIENQVNQRMM
ncbi:putative enterotoxin [Ophiocordyceps australis]|uniref:Putative enterotoxin n=1 Tax=Ophiocordyceps australis TaxID=1399860 RepID=A0A2C5YBK0_9HYPO|nr:putative enterotoxin [Ophiocordyceps australis]